MKFSFNSFVPKLTLAAALVGTLAGCDDPEYATPTPVTTSAVGQARVLVVNAAPGTAGASVSIDNVASGTALPYLGVSSVTSVAAGQRLFLYNDANNIPATPAAATTAGVAPLTTPRTFAARSSFSGGLNYTTFITDAPTRAYVYPVTATSDQGGIRTLTLTDDLSAPAVATNAKIRFVNLASTGTYGIYNSITQASLFSAVPLRGYRLSTNTSTATPPVTTNFAAFTEVPAGTYTLDVRSTATAPLVGTQQVITLTAGKIYTLYVRGISGNTTTPRGISVVPHN